jgi:hypothetical protein
MRGPPSALSTTFSLTRKSLLLLPTLVDRLDVIGQLDTTVGSIKQGRRGHTGGELLVGVAGRVLQVSAYQSGSLITTARSLRWTARRVTCESWCAA